MLTRRTRRYVGAAGGILLLSALILAVPSFACSPSAQITTRPARAQAGSMVDVSGRTFDPGVVRIWFDNTSGVPMAELRAQPDGTFTQSVRIPASAQPGSHSIVATLRSERDGRSYTAPTSFIVEGAARSPSPPPVVAPPAQSSPTAPSPAQAAQPATARQTSRVPGLAPGAAASPQGTGTPAAQAQPGTGALAELGTGNGVLPSTDPLPPPAQSGLVHPTAGAETDRAASTAQRTVDVGGPSPWWLVPLSVLGATLLSLSAASVVQELRQRRKAEVEA
jgi:hypothetical protein